MKSSNFPLAIAPVAVPQAASGCCQSQDAGESEQATEGCCSQDAAAAPAADPLRDKQPAAGGCCGGSGKRAPATR